MIRPKISDIAKSSFWSRLAVNIALVLASIGLALGALELGLRIIKFPGDSFIPEQCLAIKNSINSTYTHSMRFASYPPLTELPVCSQEFLIKNKSDNIGYLGLGSSSDSQHSDILVFGDSFAFGYGVPQGHSFAGLIGAYNAGLWGNSFPQHLRAFQNVLSVKKPRRAYWVIYPPHLISLDSVGWNTQTNVIKDIHPLLYGLIEQFNRTQLSTALLATLGLGYNRGDFYTPEWALLDSNKFHPEGSYSAFKETAIGIVKLASTHEIQLIPVFMPSKLQLMLETKGTEDQRPLFLSGTARIDPRLPIKRLAKILAESGVPVEQQVDLLPHFSRSNGWQTLYFKYDAHLNENGHKFVAGILRSL